MANILKSFFCQCACPEGFLGRQTAGFANVELHHKKPSYAAIIGEKL